MWLGFAVGSAFFAGITSILAKCGIRKTDSDVVTAVRTIVVLIFAWIMVAVTGVSLPAEGISSKTMIFLVLSGMATGGSWLCYFKALQLGDVNKVVPVDKSSTVLTIILAFIIFKEPVTGVRLLGMLLIGIGTLMMIQKKESSDPDKKADAAASGGFSWLVYALLSAVFASLTSILGKTGIEGIDSNLGTAIRTAVVLIMAWVVVFVKGKGSEAKKINRGELVFILLSGVATGASWLCYYRALQTGPASVVVPVDKLSILVTIAFSYIVFGERLTVCSGTGLILIVAGTLGMLL